MASLSQRGTCVIGIVGLGVVGNSLAEDFTSRGYKTVGYSLDEPYFANRDRIREVDVVFVCVPTPTTSQGFDVSIVEGALSLVGEGKIAVIRSTVLPGTTRRMQEKFPTIVVLCSPELLSTATAREDVTKPFLNIIGVPQTTHRHQSAADFVHSILPNAASASTCTSEEAEIYKYAHNINGYIQIMATNIIYDTARQFNAEWGKIRAALYADPMVSKWYIDPIHNGGRGAGGTCFVKDFAAFSRLYESMVARPEGNAFLQAAQALNIALMTETNKDPHVIQEVYGATNATNEGDHAPRAVATPVE